jgi:adenylate cyclase
MWLIISNLMYLYEASILLEYESVSADYNMAARFNAALIIALVAGPVGGSVIVFFFEKWIRIWPYWRAILSMLAAYTSVFVLVAFVIFPRFGGVLSATSESSSLSEFMTSSYVLRNYVAWFLIVAITLIWQVVNDKYGPGIMLKLLMGKYFKPKTEERVVMFLDLRSSTSIAERLGEKQYFNLLHDVIQDVTQPILASQGEIFQYVGDEIIVSWPTPRAIRNSNCVKCFFEVQDAIALRANIYQTKYGVIPQYKAGLHFGNVVVGEIGLVKRDITYTGDVLNTASRIQSKCNELGVDILLSKGLLDQLKLAPNQYQPRKIGEIPLRGKQYDVLLYTM